MSTASHLVKRLQNLYGKLLRNMREMEWLMARGLRRVAQAPQPHAVLEQCEPRILMSGATVGIAASSHNLLEGDTSPAIFVVSRDDTASDLTVNYDIGGTAGAADYSASPSLAGSIVIPDGQSSASIDILALTDNMVEGDEALSLSLRDGTGYQVDVLAASDAITIVDATPTEADSANFVSCRVPSYMVAGQTCTVSVTMRNTGLATWMAAGLWRLGSQGPQDNFDWGLARVQPDADAATGQEATFTFDVVAPSVAGDYAFNWRMVHEFVQWFGDSPSVNVTVIGVHLAGMMSPFDD